MVANIHPEVEQLEETISTLKFATRMMKVSNEPLLNLQHDPKVLLKRYEKEIRDLKQELAMHDTLARRGKVQYDSYSPDQQVEVQKIAMQYLSGEIEEVEDVNSIRQVRELFEQMRNIYKKLDLEVKNGFVADQTSKGHHDKSLGKIDPQKKAEETAKVDDETQQHEEDEKQGHRKPLDKQTAFQEYKQGEGRMFEDQIISNRQELKDKKVKVKKLTEQCNTTKKEMDQIKEKLDDKAVEKKKQLKNDFAGMDEDEMGNPVGEGQQEIIDEEELGCMQRMRDLKKVYRERYEQLMSLRGEVFYIQQSIDTLKSQLVSNFEDWYTQNYYEDETIQGVSSFIS